MPYPHDQLTDGERVLVHQHPHWKVLLLPATGAALVLAGCTYLATLAASSDIRSFIWIALALAAALATLRLVGIPLLRWSTTHFVLTDDKVMFREGVIRRTGMNIPAYRIASVQTEIDLNDRLFGCGTLIVESASQQPMRFTDIAHVADVHHLMEQALDGNTSHFAPLAH